MHVGFDILPSWRWILNSHFNPFWWVFWVSRCVPSVCHFNKSSSIRGAYTGASYGALGFTCPCHLCHRIVCFSSIFCWQTRSLIRISSSLGLFPAVYFWRVYRFENVSNVGKGFVCSSWILLISNECDFNILFVLLDQIRVLMTWATLK